MSAKKILVIDDDEDLLFVLRERLILAGYDVATEVNAVKAIGIHKDDIERVFNKYEQVSLQSPAGVSGLGLGLSTCKTIVDMHGGRIWVVSKPGEGSTFTFQIPIGPY